MSKTVKDFMTIHPHSIGFDQHLSKAQELLREHKIRHLPVLKGGKIIGIITDRDIKLAQALLTSQEKHDIQVGEICTDEPYSVSPDTTLKTVASAMAEHRYGSVLVQDSGGRLLGIFTAVDACRALGTLA